MSKKFTGVHSGGQNIPVYDKDAHSAIEQKLNTSAFQSVSGNFLTAVPDAYATKEYAAAAAASAANAAASGKLDKDTFAQVSGDFLTAVPQSYLQNTDLTVTSGKVTEISGIPLSAGGTLPDTIPVSGVSGISVTETENEVLIGISADFATSADLESKLDTSAFSSVSGDFLTAVPDDFATKEYLLSQISGKYDTSSFAEVSGNFLTAVPESAISGFATHEEVESATSGKADVSALEGLATETYVNSAVSGKQDASAMTAYQAVGNYLSASESANFYPMSGNPSGFLTEHQSLAGYLQNSDLTIVDDKITEISGVPLSAGDELPQSVTDAADYVSANSGNIDATIENVSSNSGAWGGSALPISARDGLDLEMSGGMLWIGASALNETLSGKQEALTFEYNASDAISAINGSALAGGGDVPEGVMVESAVGYNAVNEISGYNGSAIAQYGAEKQWLVHDDTLVHAANSAQYALGVNLSAVAQLLGVDETVLWSGADTPGVGTSITNKNYTLSESVDNFDHLKIIAGGKCGGIFTMPVSGSRDDPSMFYTASPDSLSNTTICGLRISLDKTIRTTINFRCGYSTTWADAYRQGDDWGYFTLYKVIGIGRK